LSSESRRLIHGEIRRAAYHFGSHASAHALVRWNKLVGIQHSVKVILSFSFQEAISTNGNSHDMSGNETDRKPQDRFVHLFFTSSS